MQETKICRKCGEVKGATGFSPDKKTRDGLAVYCKECKSQYTRAWYARNQEKRQTYGKEHADQVKRHGWDWRKRNPERFQESRRATLARHPETIERTRTAQKAMRRVDKRHIVSVHNHNAKRLGVEGTFTLQEWLDLCATYGNVCVCCKQPRVLTVDHVVPMQHGGTNYISNIQPLCGPCNSRKHDKTIDYRGQR